MGYHAVKSPSSAHRWTSCTASIKAAYGRPNTSSEAAREGTCCHQILAECLVADEPDFQAYLGRKLIFWFHPGSDSYGEDWDETFADMTLSEDLDQMFEQVVTIEMLNAVATVYRFVMDLVTMKGAEMEVEQAVPIGWFTGERGATGSADIILFYCIGDEWFIHVIDAKFGRHRVMASDVVQSAGEDPITGEPVPEIVMPNLQMACYALGAHYKWEPFFPAFAKVTMTIVQPFINHVSEFTCDLGDMEPVREFLARKAQECETNPVFVPSAENCHFCRASGDCAAQTQMVLDAAVDGFEDELTATPKPIFVPELGAMYQLVGLVRRWADAVEKRTREQIQQGYTVQRSDGTRLVLGEGKMGARKWRDEKLAEAAMLKMRMERTIMYKQALISPAQVEALSKRKRGEKGSPMIPAVLGPTQWKKLQDLMVQERTQPVIMLETDSRSKVDTDLGFDDVEVEDDDLF